MKIFYYVYKITNLANNKIYIGCHMTKNLDDNYMGSGKRLAYAKKKYGIENFKKEILSFHNSVEEMLEEEKKLVDEEFLGRKDVYNLLLGGKGSWFYINSPQFSQKMKVIRSKNCSNIPYDRRLFGARKSGLMTKGQKIFKDVSFQIEMKNRSLSEKSKNKRKQTFKNIKHQQGLNNSNYGTCWIFYELIKKSIKIKKELLPYYIDQGWMIGRKIKFLES